METTAERSLLADAGRLVDRHAMIWIRTLQAPVEQVWETVSTREGLARWWIVPPAEFELRAGGRFKHHWENTITDFRRHEFIDFAEPAGRYAATGGMRFELRADGDSTLFAFLDTWGDGMVATGEGVGARQPGGPGTPWAGVAAGWHATIDALETVVSGRDSPHGYDELVRFYEAHLRDLYRWHDMVQRTGSR
jgi:uncharacterized protein YndB with AHSA1/START domain